MGSKRSFVHFLLLGGISLVLRHLSAFAVIPNSPHDDLLQVRLANSIAAGEWLGPYAELGHLTMVKPPGYALLLAFSIWTHIPAQSLVHLGIVITTGLLVRLVVPPEFHLTQLACYSIGIFWPTLFGAQFSRFYREGLVYLLLLVFLSLLILILKLTTELDSRGCSRVYLVVGIAGFLFGVVAITKPVLLALVPGFCFVLMLASVRLWRYSKSFSAIFSRLIVLLALAAGTAALPVLGVSYANEQKYGVFQVDSYSSGQFQQTLSALTRLPPSSDSQMIMVSNDQIRTWSRLGASSQNVAKEFLSGNLSNWNTVSCEHQGPCDNPGGWFMFALRDAIALSGGDTSALAFNTVLEEIESEVQQFCKEQGTCGRGDVAIGVKFPTMWDFREFWNSFFVVASELLFPDAGEIKPLIEESQPADVVSDWSNIPGVPRSDSFASFTNPIPHMLEQIFRPVPVFLVLLFIYKRTKFRVPSSVHSHKLSRFHKFASSELHWLLVSDWRRSSVTVTILTLLATIFQLAALQSSSGVYLTQGASTYAITCLAPLLVLLVLFVGFLRDASPSCVSRQ